MQDCTIYSSSLQTGDPAVQLKRHTQYDHSATEPYFPTTNLPQTDPLHLLRNPGTVAIVVTEPRSSGLELNWEDQWQGRMALLQNSKHYSHRGGKRQDDGFGLQNRGLENPGIQKAILCVYVRACERE